jgi:hypothetical protein
MLWDASDLLQAQCAVGLTFGEAFPLVCINLGEETRLQIIEEAQPQRRGPPTARIRL